MIAICEEYIAIIRHNEDRTCFHEKIDRKDDNKRPKSEIMIIPKFHYNFHKDRMKVIESSLCKHSCLIIQTNELDDETLHENLLCNSMFICTGIRIARQVRPLFFQGEGHYAWE